MCQKVSQNITDCHRSEELTEWHCVSSLPRPHQMLSCQSSSESRSPNHESHVEHIIAAAVSE